MPTLFAIILMVPIMVALGVCAIAPLIVEKRRGPRSKDGE